ncbi:CPBP family intramembrane glutamic endopeptidase [Lacinutrix jangbogonensis]|uniref:CPBP family intramembrane glutamic endopeptidase n=1 Tax=Lacinutrix jangbogonensis TaxID=1469557 RepID=UPI00053F0929|nr:type II CAAX endopeptidase family protein [Lacinutrix jangbogonensis]
MKTQIYNFLTRPYIVVLTMIIAPVFGFIDRNFVFFFGLGIAFLILWGSNFDWSRFGIGKKISKKTVLISLILTLVFLAGFYVIIDPLLQLFLGDFDLSSLEDIRGNLVGYIVLMIVMWIFAAFGEEFLFRGYYMKALAELLGNSNKAWLLSAFITSIYFGVSHGYQGAIGIISSFLWSFFISMLFNRNRSHLLLLVLVHGFFDTVGITLLYLNKDHVISDWIQHMF